MAYSDDRILIKHTRESAKTLGIAASWVKSRQPIDLEKDFVFELYILFELIKDLSKYYHIIYCPGSDNKKNMFPKKPALKTGRPKFEIYDKSTNKLLWQICPGIKITDIVSKERAPDISFQSHNASDSPTYEDVELIWDAKYRKNNKDRITQPELSEFGRWIDLLDIKNEIKPNMLLSTFKKMNANCLITNGNKSTEPDSERIRLDLKEVSSFFPNVKFKVAP